LIAIDLIDDVILIFTLYKEGLLLLLFFALSL